MLLTEVVFLHLPSSGQMSFLTERQRREMNLLRERSLQRISVGNHQFFWLLWLKHGKSFSTTHLIYIQVDWRSPHKWFCWARGQTLMVLCAYYVPSTAVGPQHSYLTHPSRFVDCRFHFPELQSRNFGTRTLCSITQLTAWYSRIPRFHHCSKIRKSMRSPRGCSYL